MECRDAKLKVQALIDNELPQEEIDEVVDHIQSCYRCREDYVSLLKLQRKMKGLQYPEPPKEWFEELQKKRGRRLSSSLGLVLFLGSYLLLLGYALYSLFSDSGAGLFIKIVVGGIIAGMLFLLGVTIADRVRESKTDKYKEVMK
ncbi:MAG: zf-HC2 domain-containing protein [Spirochaetales bacterium]|nr:zf-HC2 domain-containing protein [Spirochaetales bacterium]